MSNTQQPYMENDKDLGWFRNGTSKDTLFEKAVDTFKESGIPLGLLKKYIIKIFNGRNSELKKRLGFEKLKSGDLQQITRLVEMPHLDKGGDIDDYSTFKLIPAIDNIKYLVPKGKAPIPYILPEVWGVRDKTNKPLWLTEGIKKALALHFHNRHVISITGVWNFNAQNSRSLAEELMDFKWHKRTVYLAYDSDLWSNPSVRYAHYELSFKLYGLGAIMNIVTWHGAKGVDDYLIKQVKPDESLDDLEAKSIGLLDFCHSEHTDEIIRALVCSECSDNVMRYEQTLKVLSTKLRIPANRLSKYICNQKHKYLQKQVDKATTIDKINTPKVKTILQFAKLGQSKNEYFCEIQKTPENKRHKFLSQYSIDLAATVPKRQTSVTEKGKLKIKFHPLIEAQIFNAGLHLIFYGEQVFLYRNGRYQACHDRLLLKLIEMQIASTFSGRRGASKEILEVLKDQLHNEDLEINTDHNLINVKNGLLDITNIENVRSIDKLKLLPHTPTVIQTYQINANFKETSCDMFQNFLNDVLVKEDILEVEKELKRLVRQFLGYCLYLKVTIHECLMLYGSGRNGKSVLVFVIKHLFKGLTSNVYFEDIGEDIFASSDLLGKLINISSELGVNARLSDGRIKDVIGCDEQRAQRKHQPSFDFRPIAKHIITTNNLPRSKDKSLGFFSRFKIIPFHRTYLSPKEIENINDKDLEDTYKIRDTNLEDKLKSELDGILYWTIGGLKDLQEEKEFCYSKQVEKYKNIFKIRSTSVESFLKESTNDSVTVDDEDNPIMTELPKLYKKYISYCKNYTIAPEPNRRFASTIRNLGYEIDRRKGNKQYVLGIDLEI